MAFLLSPRLRLDILKAAQLGIVNLTLSMDVVIWRTRASSIIRHIRESFVFGYNHGLLRFIGKGAHRS
jgi:hypothetical protein